MSEASQNNVESGPGLPEKREPRINKFATKGIKTSRDFANLMSALISDLIDKRVSSETGSAVCLAGGRLLRVIEMEYRFRGKGGAPVESQALTLADESDG